MEKKMIYKFGFYDLDGELVEIKVISTSKGKARTKAQNILKGQYNLDEGFWLNDEYEY